MAKMTARDGDHCDEILSEWRRAYPSVDASPIGVTGRVTRIALYTERNADDHLERYRLTPSGFEVLLALHASPRHRLSPTLLAKRRQMSSAGITGLVDQLVTLGLAARSRERHDRRRVQVSRTRQGSEMVAIAGAGWRRNQQRLVRALGADSVRSLDQLLGRLVGAVDPGANGSHDGNRRAMGRVGRPLRRDFRAPPPGRPSGALALPVFRREPRPPAEPSPGAATTGGPRPAA